MAAVLVGKDITALSASLVVGIKAPIECWPIAVDRVRYVGEPVAVVVASSRYIAEDALDLIEVDYEPLPAIVDPLAALDPAQPALHDGLGSNVASERSFRYGDPERAFADAARRVSVTIRYPRNSCTPIETYGLVAEYDAAEDAYDVLANFMGPFSLHAVMARALKVPGNRFRLRTPADSGGSFGVKQGVFPYIVLMGVASRACGRPVKWIEDRLEHLSASVSATNRVTTLEAAVDADGRVRALAWDQIEDVGAHIRAPEPATLYRMHGNLTGAYDIRHVSVRNRVVLTNKTPTGLNRGFGGPQVYYALERLMQRVAIELDLDPVEVIRKNLVPSGSFPYSTATGATLDSGDYTLAFETALADGGFADAARTAEQARAQGRIYGIGLTAAVEPSVSNMGYITTVLTPEERRKAGPKNGAQATATVALDPLGGVSVHVASVPQGQGHRTVLAQIVADALGLKPSDIRVITDLDTARDAWSIASGNYSSRFAAAVGGAAHLAALKIKAKLGKIGGLAAQCRGRRHRIRRRPRAGARQSRQRCLIFPACCHQPLVARPCGRREPGATRDRVLDTAGTDAADQERRNQFLALSRLHFRFLRRRDRSHHRRGAHRQIRHHARLRPHPASRHGGRADHRRLRPCRRRGAVRGIRLRPDGSFLTGTFADYLVPTAMEVATPLILHIETPSPFTPLGAKGVGEGNCMSTPVCIANAVADALGIASIDLPLTPAKVAAHLHGAESEQRRPRGASHLPAHKGRTLHGSGQARVSAAARGGVGACCSTRKHWKRSFPAATASRSCPIRISAPRSRSASARSPAATRPTSRCPTSIRPRP